MFNIIILGIEHKYEANIICTHWHNITDRSSMQFNELVFSVCMNRKIMIN